MTHLSGVLDAAFISKPFAGPPLSVVNAITVLFNIPRASNSLVMLPMESSKADAMPVNVKYNLLSIEWNYIRLGGGSREWWGIYGMVGVMGRVPGDSGVAGLGDSGGPGVGVVV